MSIYSVEQLRSLTGTPEGEQIKQEDANAQTQQVETTKVEDTKVEDAAAQDDKTAQTETTQQVNVDELVQERLKQLTESGEFIDKSTYEKSLAEREIKNDFIKQLAELDKGTGKVNKDFLRSYLTDWDAYDTKNVKQATSLLEQSLMEAEGLDKDLARYKLEDKYPALFEEDPDTESREYQKQLKLAQHEASKFIAAKKQEQQALALKDPEGLVNENREQIIEEFVKQQSSKQQEVLQAWSDYAEKVSTKIDKQVYEVDGNQFEINFTAEEKQQLKEMYANAPRLIDLFFSKENGLDEARLNQFILNGLFSQKIIQSIAKDAIAMGESKKFKETKNATSTTQTIVPTTPDKAKELTNVLQKYGYKV